MYFSPNPQYTFRSVPHKKSESPSVTWMVEVTDTAEGIFPSASAGKTYSPSDWLMV